MSKAKSKGRPAGMWILDNGGFAAKEPAPVHSSTGTAYKGYLIRPLLLQGYSIEKGGHVVQHFCASIEAAKLVIDGLTN